MSIKKYISRKEQLWLRQLEKESNHLLNLLAEEPANSKLVSLLNEIDIKILTITKEHSIEY